MEADEVLKLLDSCWFGPKGPKLLDSCWFGPKVVDLFDSCLLIWPKVLELCDSWSESTGGSSTAMLMAYKMDESKTTGEKNLRIRSLSDRCIGVNMSSYCEAGAASRGSEIIKPKLQKILSGEVVGLSVEVTDQQQENAAKYSIKTRRCRGRKGRKGSMDLGFVFNEEDKNPGVISVIPRPQMATDEEEEELWSGKSNFLMDWKIPYLQNEIRMKDQLRVWAHTVASKVR